MKRSRVMNIVFAFGLAALVLRRQLYLTATDEKGLLLRMHPLGIALLLMTAAVLLVIYLAVRNVQDSGAWEEGNSSGLLAALGHVAMAAGILITALTGVPRAAGSLGEVWKWLGLASPVCLVAAAGADVRKQKPFFLVHVVTCLLFAVHIISNYQIWSGNPQMQDYVFELLGAMALMFYSFYMAAMEAGCGSRRMLLGMGLAAVYMCLAALVNSGCPLLYLAGAVWVWAGLCSFRSVQTEEKD